MPYMRNEDGGYEEGEPWAKVAVVCPGVFNSESVSTTYKNTEGLAGSRATERVIAQEPAPTALEFEA